MPYRRADADYLREKVRQFRLLAGDCSDTPTAAKMLEIAAELEAKATEIERRPDPRRPS